MHTVIRTEERERQPTTFSFTEGRGQSAVWAPTRTRGYVFGGEIPGKTSQIWRFNPVLETADSPHALPAATSYTSSVWAESSLAAYIFGGERTTGPTNCVAKYTGLANAFCIAVTLPTARSGTSAAFDGTYAYVFGGRDATPAYLNTILRFDVASEAFVAWPGCNPVLLEAIAYSSAAWDPTQSVAYVFGGQHFDPDPLTGGDISYLRVQKFNPNALPCPTVQDIGQLPCQPWDGTLCTRAVLATGTTAVHVTGTGVVLVAGGKFYDDTIIGGTFAVYGRYIYEFTTASNSFTLKFVDLPTCKADGAAIWYPAPVGTSRMYYFAGWVDDPVSLDACGGGNQVIRYERNTH